MSHAERLSDPAYLGDGVYAAHDGYQVWVWTSDGVTESTPIAMEPAVLASLRGYAGRLGMGPRDSRPEEERA